MYNDLIIINEYCDKCQIEPSFVLMLGEDGLIEIREIDHQKYILVSQLAELERYSRLYYDLSINIAGLGAIHHILEKVQQMQEEIHHLHRELNFYRE